MVTFLVEYMEALKDASQIPEGVASCGHVFTANICQQDQSTIREAIWRAGVSDGGYSAKCWDGLARLADKVRATEGGSELWDRFGGKVELLMEESWHDSNIEAALEALRQISRSLVRAEEARLIRSRKRGRSATLHVIIV